MHHHTWVYPLLFKFRRCRTCVKRSMYFTKTRNHHRPSQQGLEATKKVLIIKEAKKLGTRLRLTSLLSNLIALLHDTLPRLPLQARIIQVYGGYRTRSWSQARDQLYSQRDAFLAIIPKALSSVGTSRHSQTHLLSGLSTLWDTSPFPHSPQPASTILSRLTTLSSSLEGLISTLHIQAHPSSYSCF